MLEILSTTQLTPPGKKEPEVKAVKVTKILQSWGMAGPNRAPKFDSKMVEMGGKVLNHMKC